MTTSIGVIQFPGTNCEDDVAFALGQLGADVRIVWHGDALPSGLGAVVIPGGFAHGDYLRTGFAALASPVMASVVEFAHAGGPVVGICNGFQILTEAKLLPGTLAKNIGLKFICATVRVSVDCRTPTALTTPESYGRELDIPINHFEGNYLCDQPTLGELIEGDRVVLRYKTNPNGSLDNIAGICNEARNVVGIMPHPERAFDALLGSSDGLVLLRSLLAACEARVPIVSSSRL